ncbi:hypothetical protein GCM10023100_46370 [Actinocorallia cavernae]|uniref:Uncharacterized protein n=2 Tax=Actinomycetes TaxID=1760 RepID=A0ABP8SUS7_9ACTN
MRLGLRALGTAGTQHIGEGGRFGAGQVRHRSPLRQGPPRTRPRAALYLPNMLEQFAKETLAAVEAVRVGVRGAATRSSYAVRWNPVSPVSRAVLVPLPDV